MLKEITERKGGTLVSAGEKKARASQRDKEG